VCVCTLVFLFTLSLLCGVFVQIFSGEKLGESKFSPTFSPEKISLLFVQFCGEFLGENYN